MRDSIAGLGPESRFSLFRRATGRRILKSSAAAAPALLLVAMLVAAPAQAQYKAKVVVDPSKAKALFYPTSLGTAAEAYDAQPFSAATVQLLVDAGISNIRYPGNGGIDALYHWSTGAITNPYTNDKAPDFYAEKQFPRVLPQLSQVGTTLITVNYGSNLDGSGGGEPAEAAAWVAYANGSAKSAVAIGKDSKGNDWKTVGYWASLRAADPLPADDGLNALRISHAAPLGIQLWAIGNEPWNDGFYNNDDAGEPDLHAGKVPTRKEWRRHSGDKRAGPTTYGPAVVQYIKAMKAVDPSILVGASLKTVDPGDGDHKGKNRNSEVLKDACASMDFGAVSMASGNALTSDYKTLDEPDLLTNALSRGYGLIANDLGNTMKSACPAGHTPGLAFTSFGVSAWMPIKHPVVVGMFAAEAIAILLATGVYTVTWTPVHSVLMLDDGNNPKPAYYGIKMIHEMAGPGDVFVSATTPLTALGVHAVKRADGGLGLLLVGREVNQAVKATVTVEGYNYATTGTKYEWSQTQLDAGNGITETPIDNLGPTFTVDVPRSGIVAIVIPKAK